MREGSGPLALHSKAPSHSARVQTRIKALDRSGPCLAVLILQGSGAKDPAAFAAAIAKARSVCDAGMAVGLEMNTVDIGGGYVSCGTAGVHGDKPGCCGYRLQTSYLKHSLGGCMIEPLIFTVCRMPATLAQLLRDNLLQNLHTPGLSVWRRCIARWPGWRRLGDCSPGGHQQSAGNTLPSAKYSCHRRARAVHGAGRCHHRVCNQWRAAAARPGACAQRACGEFHNVSQQDSVTY